MKKYYSIVGAYEFTDKKTKEKKFWITGILQSKYPVRWTREFFFLEDEFFAKFGNQYNPEDFNLGLKGFFLEVLESVNLVDEIPE